MSIEHQPLSHSNVAEPPRKLVIVVGFWLIFGTTALSALAAVPAALENGKPLGAIVSLGIAAFAGYVTALATRGFRRRHCVTDQNHG